MYMPAAGIRSKLRGACTQLLREALVTRSLPLLSLQDAQLLRLGGVKQSGSEAPIPHDEFQNMLTANPLLSLFGASTPWIDGKLMVGHLYCKEANSDTFGPMLVDGVRSNMLRREPETVEFLTESAMQDYVQEALSVRNSVAAKGRLKVLDKAIKNERDADKRRDLKQEYDALAKASKNVIVVPEGMPLSGYEAIPMGSDMDQKIRLLNASQIELGCLLASIERFAMTPLLGAHLAHGCGEVEGFWNVSSGGKDIGEVHLVPWAGIRIVESGDTLQTALDAFNGFLSKGDLQPWTPSFVKGLATEVADDE